MKSLYRWDVRSGVFIILQILSSHCYYDVLVQLAMQHIPASTNCYLLLGLRVTIIYLLGIFFSVLWCPKIFEKRQHILTIHY